MCLLLVLRKPMVDLKKMAFDLSAHKRSVNVISGTQLKDPKDTAVECKVCGAVVCLKTWLASVLSASVVSVVLTSMSDSPLSCDISIGMYLGDPCFILAEKTLHNFCLLLST